MEKSFFPSDIRSLKVFNSKLQPSRLLIIRGSGVGYFLVYGLFGLIPNIMVKIAVLLVEKFVFKRALLKTNFSTNKTAIFTIMLGIKPKRPYTRK